VRKVLRICDDEENSGLSDSLITELDNLSLPVFNLNHTHKELKKEYKHSANNIVESKFVQWLLKTSLNDNTGINNTLIFQFKCLCKDNGIDINCKEILHIKRLLDKKFGRVFAWNVPDKQYHFSPNAINNYCIENKLPPLYKIWEDSPTFQKFNDTIFTYKNYTIYKSMFNDNDKLNVSCLSDAMYHLKNEWVRTIYIGF